MTIDKVIDLADDFMDDWYDQDHDGKIEPTVDDVSKWCSRWGINPAYAVIMLDHIKRLYYTDDHISDILIY